MKLADLFESRSVRRLFEVEVDFEPEDPSMPQTITVVVAGYVTVERDPYGTGDSPTSYEVHPTQSYNKDTDDPVDIDNLPSYLQDEIQNNAVEQVL